METPLLQITPRLFSNAIDKNANVRTYFSRVGSSIVCALIFRRNPLEEKEFQLLYMLVELEAVYISVSGKDRRVWAMSTDGSLSISSFFKSPVERPFVASFWCSLWSFKAPPRVLAFAWSALLGEILFIDNLNRHGIVLANACPFVPQ